MKALNEADIPRIIEMAWEDRTRLRRSTNLRSE